MIRSQRESLLVLGRLEEECVEVEAARRHARAITMSIRQ
jgi:hypothetical protein